MKNYTRWTKNEVKQTTKPIKVETQNKDSVFTSVKPPKWKKK